MTRGWIKIHRKIFDNELIAADNDMLALWIRMLTMAVSKPMQVSFGKSTVTLLPGQLIAGRNDLAERCNVNASKVERMLKALEKAGQIEQRTEKKGRVITIKNWSEYQSSKKQSEQQNEHQSEHQSEQQMKPRNALGSRGSGHTPRKSEHQSEQQSEHQNEHYKRIYKEYIKNNIILDCQDTRAYARENTDRTDRTKNENLILTSGDKSNDGKLTDAEGDKMQLWGGKLGQGVLFMSDNQFEELCDMMPLDVLEAYIGKIVSYTKTKGKTVKNHYKRIKEWYKADYGVK